MMGDEYSFDFKATGVDANAAILAPAHPARPPDLSQPLLLNAAPNPGAFPVPPAVSLTVDSTPEAGSTPVAKAQEVKCLPYLSLVFKGPEPIFAATVIAVLGIAVRLQGDGEGLSTIQVLSQSWTNINPLWNQQ